jgi:hypothetical protein
MVIAVPSAALPTISPTGSKKELLEGLSDDSKDQDLVDIP